MFTLSFPGYALSGSMGVLLFFRMLQGVAFGISGTANMALVAEVKKSAMFEIPRCSPNSTRKELVTPFAMENIPAVNA